MLIKESQQKYQINNSSHYEKFRDVPEPIGMNILNFIKFEKYYCQIDDLFRIKLKNKINNYSKFSRRVNVSRETIKRIVSLTGYWINFKVLLELANILDISQDLLYQKIIRIKTHNSFPIKFSLKKLESEEFFRILGHILGDGGIHVIKNEGKYRAFYSNNENILIDSFMKDVYSVFGNLKLYTRRISERNKASEVWLPTTLGLLLYQIMQYNLLDDKTVPEIISRQKDVRLIGPFLQALYDDDGFLYPDKSMIVFSQKRKWIVEDVREIVQKLGIETNPIRVHKSKTRTTMYYFNITGRKNIFNFYDLVNFKHPIKSVKLEKMVNKYW